MLSTDSDILMFSALFFNQNVWCFIDNSFILVTRPFPEFEHFPALALVFEMATTEMLFDGSLFFTYHYLHNMIALEIKCQ